MKYLKTLLIFTAFPALLFAQSNYKPGYVINLRGDTLKGFIDFREWDLNPEFINFKHTISDAQSSKFGPADVSYAEVTGLAAFRTYTGSITNDSTNPDNRAGDETAPDTSMRMASIFLKVLEAGSKVTLYSFKDEYKTRYFIAETPDSKPIELIYRASKLSEQNTYRKQLSAVALKFNELDDPTITQIARAEYSDDDLVKIANKVNHISTEAYKKKYYTGKSYNFFIGAGVNINNISPATDGVYYGAGGRAVTSYRPAVFFGANFFANPATRKLQFRIELSAAQSQYKSLYTSNYYPYVPTEASYDELALSATPMIIFNFYNTDNLKFFAGAGLSVTYYKFSNSYLGTQKHDNSESDIAANDPYYFNTFDDTFVVRAGVQIGKRFIIFGDLQSGVASTKGGYFELTSTCKHIGLNYLFE
jgi:hypothetical protein